jgi:hypothetical protein
MNALVVFVPTRLVNPTNVREHWSVRAKRAKVQRKACALTCTYRMVDALRSGNLGMLGHPENLKRITFTAHVTRKFDDDGLQSALKHIRDGLQDAGLIHSDGPDSGHVFTYAQRVAKPTGVEIRVECA